MKKLIFLITLMTASAYAHDGGHGPKLGDQPKYGGKVAAVINKKEVKKGTDAKLLYKAELTKNSQNIIRVYMYNTKMKLMNLNNLKNANKSRFTFFAYYHRKEHKKQPYASFNP